MDQKEHIATLCALGTVGAAAAGLAFGTDQVDSHILRPGKRKWPGSSTSTWPLPPTTIALPRRSVSQPTSPLLTSEVSGPISQSTRPYRQWSAPRLFAGGREDVSNDVPSSRGSSTSRRSMLRPRTAASRSTTDKRESSTSSGWLKRLSSFSTHSTSPASSTNFQEKDESGVSPIISPRPSTSLASIPNKLVKRSVSQRGLSHDEARGQILRRPATSHQRSFTFREILSRPISNNTNNTEPHHTSNVLPTVLSTENGKRSWRPFFETAFPRKRRRSESATDGSQIRVVSLPPGQNPTMLLGSHLEDIRLPEDINDRPQPHLSSTTDALTGTRRSRRSLSSLRRGTRRRNFTDPSPSVHLTRAAANGTISPINGNAQSASALSGSAFHIQLPPGTPQFTSSPPMFQYENRSSFRPRGSLSASDPPTTGSDTDGQVFSDTESLEFRSDTAYDSIATRATTASHSGARDSKLETIFANRTSDEMEARTEMWQNFDEPEIFETQKIQDSPFHHDDVEMHGIGISITNGKHSFVSSPPKDVTMATPPRSVSLHTDDLSVTPVPMRTTKVDIDSSPPSLPIINHSNDDDQVNQMLDDMQIDDIKLDGDEELDWSMDGASVHGEFQQVLEARQVMSSPGFSTHHFLSQFQESDDPETEPEMHSGHTNGQTQRPSIFDWSEHQQMTNFSRPKTVHGKQGNGDRSRPSGRKGPSQLHFRSQSVPVNRDGPSEELPTTSKYQTWRLGHKPVSEEWSDDFEFDDNENVDVVLPTVDESCTNFKDSVRSVRIPQAIIDRQPSVHLQFGQVQEFMALVEELKRLRVRAITLQILNGNARHLWEDAESIINLATINDEEGTTTMPSPASSDPFAEIVSATPIVTATLAPIRERRPTTSGRRSVSTMTTPPVYARARGESLVQARHFLQTMHQNRSGFDSSPQELEIHQQKKLPFDTQDLKDLVVRSGVITRALKEEIRRAEGVSVSPHKTPPSKNISLRLNEIFIAPELHETSPCPPFRKPGLPKSRSANSYLGSPGPRQQSGPFSSPITVAAVI